MEMPTRIILDNHIQFKIGGDTNSPVTIYVTNTMFYINYLLVFPFIQHTNRNHTYVDSVHIQLRF